MKIVKFKSYLTITAVLCIAATISCERGFSDEIAVATYPSTPEVFTDFPVGLTDAFFVSFDPADGANVNGFGTDDNDAYRGNSSIRIEVPAPNDPDGGFIGGIFLDRGNGRDLTSYDALTFWAKGSTTADVGFLGFGTDFDGDTYAVSLSDVTLSTDWKQYVIPIPDASKLVQEKGMFAFSAGTQSTNGLGYSIWIDEIRFEKLGTIAQPRPYIFGGVNDTIVSFNTAKITPTDLGITFNLGNGLDLDVDAAKGYFDFESSDSAVVNISDSGTITVVGKGTAKITASQNGIKANGSLTIVNSLGDFELAPMPTQSASIVISVFSDAYENVPIDFYNGYWEPWQTTTSADFDINGDHILNYENFNFVGQQFANPTVDASSMTHFHFDIYVPGELPAGARIKVTIKDFGPNGEDNQGRGDDTIQVFALSSGDFTANAWKSFNIPLSLSPRTKVGQFIFENYDGGKNLIKNFYMDNVYFYKQ